MSCTSSTKSNNSRSPLSQPRAGPTAASSSSNSSGGGNCTRRSPRRGGSRARPARGAVIAPGSERSPAALCRRPTPGTWRAARAAGTVPGSQEHGPLRRSRRPPGRPPRRRSSGGGSRRTRPALPRSRGPSPPGLQTAGEPAPGAEGAEGGGFPSL